MPITERTLKEWRRQALQERQSIEGWDNTVEFTSHRREMCERILRLTQELIDISLMKKEKKQ